MTTQESPKYSKLPINKLLVDSRYQRSLDEHRVGRIVKSFDRRQLGAIEVSKRPGGQIAIFDGQHRVAALRKLGRKTVPALVHEGLDSVDEARLFVRLQTDRKAPVPVERFKARLFCGDPAAKEISRIVTDCGFIVSMNPGDIRAVTALERAHKMHGSITLREALLTIKDMWYGDRGSTDGHIIEGVAQFLADYGDKFHGSAKDRLRAVAPVVISRKAMGGMTGGGSAMRFGIAAEIRKITGVRGRPRTKAGA